MKITKVGAVTTALFLTSMVGTELAINQKKQDYIEAYKSDIAEKDSLRFKRVNDVTRDTENTYALFNIWQDEHIKMYDSIKKVGISQKAEFEASQKLKK